MASRRHLLQTALLQLCTAMTMAMLLPMPMPIPIPMPIPMPVVHGSVATLALGLAAMAVLFATVLAWVPVLLHPLHLRVKGGLLRRAQGGIEGLDGLAAPVGFGHAL